MNDAKKRVLPLHKLDREVRSFTDDRLERGRVARSLANRISSWSEIESLSIGIAGPWGCGKTSLKNLVKAVLQDRDDAARFRWLDFEPALWSGQDQLAKRLIADMAEHFGEDFTGEKAREHVKNLKQLAAAVNLVPMDEVFWKSKPFVVVTYLLGTVGATAVGTKLLNGWEATLSYLILVLMAASFISRYVIGFLEARADVLGTRSIEEIREKVSKALSSDARRLVISFDDIDRLTPDEARQMLRVIKFVVDLPNVTVVVLYDPAVTRLLFPVPQVEDDYLQKLVRYRVDVPQLNGEVATKLVLEEVRALFDSCRGILNDDRLSHVVRLCVPWMSDLRDVKRFLASVEYAIPMVVFDSSLEVEPADFVAFLAIRHFEVDVFRAIESKTDGLLLEAQVLPEEIAAWHSKRRRLVESIVDSVSARRPDAAKKLLSYLIAGAPRDVDECRAQLRFPVAENAFRYFQFQIDHRDVGQSGILGLFEQSGNPSFVCDWLLERYHEGAWELALFRVRRLVYRLPEANALPFLLGLWDFAGSSSEILPQSSNVLLVFSEKQYAFRVLDSCAADVLRRISEDGERLRVLIEAIQRTRSLTAPLIFLTEPERLGVASRAVLVPAQGAWIKRAKERIESLGWDSIAASERIPWIVSALADLGETFQTDSLLKRIADSPGFVRVFGEQYHYLDDSVPEKYLPKGVDRRSLLAALNVNLGNSCDLTVARVRDAVQSCLDPHMA